MTNQNSKTDPYTDQSTDEWISEIDRKRRMLTRNDREYLVGEISVSDSTEYNVRHRIRNRIHGGMRDLAFLVWTDNLDMVTGFSQVPSSSRREVATNLTATVIRYNLEYLISQPITGSPDVDSDGELFGSALTLENSGDAMENTLEGALQTAVESLDGMPNLDSVDVDITFTYE